MMKVKKKNFGAHLVCGVVRALCGLVMVFILGPTVVTGNEINSPDTVGDVGRFTSLALTAKGNPVISYQDLTHRDLKLLICDDPCCAGNESNGISVQDAGGMVGSYSSLVLDAGGRPIVSYFDSSNGNLKLLHCNSPDCTSSTVSTPDSSAIVGMYTSLVLDSAGNPVVSYYDSSNGDLKLLHCDDPGCTGDESGNISTPDIEGDAGLYTSLVLDAAGNPVISYYASGQGLKLLHCDDPYCRGDESGNITTPDKGAVGWFSSLSLDAAGNPVVGYQDFSTGDMRLLHCDDSNCAGDESKNAIVLGKGGRLSMTLDAKGNPVVSFYDPSSGDLKLLHCDDPGCKGDETDNISSPDTEGDVGLYVSIALDAAGNPVISYYDFTNGDLKLMHCADNTCSDLIGEPIHSHKK